MIKNDIAQCFSRAALTYDAVALVQRTCAQRLVELLRTYVTSSWVPQTVLDVGTGTGYVIDALHPIFPQTAYTLNDIAPAMLDYCQAKFQHGHFHYCLGDIETTSISDYDLITSNFALQWVRDLQHVLHKLYAHGQVVAYTCLLKDTFAQWYDVLERLGITRPWYPSLEELKQMICHLNPKKIWFSSESFPLTFSQGRDCMRYLQHLGASTITGSKPAILPRALLTQFPIDVHYHVAYCIVIKE